MFNLPAAPLHGSDFQSPLHADTTVEQKSSTTLKYMKNLGAERAKKGTKSLLGVVFMVEF